MTPEGGGLNTLAWKPVNCVHKLHQRGKLARAGFDCENIILFTFLVCVLIMYYV